ncbi:MAG: alpha/beta fold hydrolase [Gudongella sp.]|nr:alpha/beta fold hydrolase [Gudongella sp.]
MKYPNTEIRKVEINGIPALLIRPEMRKEKYPTVIFYHGWTSNKESQSFRGFILASLGYQVLIPDALYHGDRERIDYYDKENAGVFWEVVLKNVEESKGLIESLIADYDADKDRIAVSGHSMGGFTATGVFAANRNLRTMVPLNGSGCWDLSNDIFIKVLGTSEKEKYKQLIDQVREKDPYKMAAEFIDRPVLILNGEEDNVVDPAPMRIFYETIKQEYRHKELAMMTTYKGVSHFVTTNMMEDMARWLNKYL